MVNPGKLMFFTGGRFLVIQLSEIQMMSNLTPRKIRKVRKPSISDPIDEMFKCRVVLVAFFKGKRICEKKKLLKSRLIFMNLSVAKIRKLNCRGNLKL